MQRAFVESTTLRSAGHDAQSAVLELPFCNGAVYRYLLVPQRVYRDLLGARSKGGYFNQNIRGRYPYHLVQGSSSFRP
jgi:KTSC domain-containing protein